MEAWTETQEPMSAHCLTHEADTWSWTLPILEAQREIERNVEEFGKVCKAARETARTPYTRFFQQGIFHTLIEGAEGLNALK